MKPIDDGPHSPSTISHKPVIKDPGPGDDGRAKPICIPCSAAWAKKTGLPGAVLVERCLVMRRTDGALQMVVGCHGRSALVELEPSANEARIRSIRVFQGE